MKAPTQHFVSVLQRICLLIFFGFAASAQDVARESEKPAASAAPPTIYNGDSNHIWNRLHRVLFVRVAAGDVEYGGDALDPLLWANTNHLLVGDSHREALQLLDEFINQHAAALIRDPLKRAVLQRDLWAVFDWLVKRENAAAERPRKEIRELQTRLATIIRELALTKTEISALPDNYADAAK